jgi:uncharacterized protein (TIGR02757 family)
MTSNKAEKTNYSTGELRQRLDEIYQKYHHRRFVHPDPLEFLYSYEDIKDREIAGLIASSLAYGRVTQILKSIDIILSVMGASPYEYIMNTDLNSLKDSFATFKHRFTNGDELACLVYAAREMIKNYGSLNEAFLEGYDDSHDSVLDAMLAFSGKINQQSRNSCCSLMPSHTGGSAFKRVNLYLRWMVRSDEVDPGGWKEIPASKLLIPLDIHMSRISTILGFTTRKQADLKTVLEVTESLKKIDKDDPIRYDFALTRIGINKIEEDFRPKSRKKVSFIVL